MKMCEYMNNVFDMVRYYTVVKQIKKNIKRPSIDVLLVKFRDFELYISLIDNAVLQSYIVLPAKFPDDTYKEIHYDGNQIIFLDKKYQPRPSISLKWNYIDL